MTASTLKLSCIVCLIATLGQECSTKESPPRKTTLAPASRAHENKAEQAWRENEAIIRNALAGKTHSTEKFGSACEFFEKLTGIVIRGNGSFFGWLPNQDTATDFERVEEWYATHQKLLYWDEGSKSVKVRDRKP
jgi:hypothetical protein